MKNDLILRAIKGEQVERPPVWMMRQAGRYLPEYMVLRRKYDFFTRIKTPDLACEITIQPIDIVGTDAAILFSDILTVPEAMGLEVQMVPDKGPYLPKTVKTKEDLDQLVVKDAHHEMQYVYDAIKVTKEALNDRVPLIGFAGAPFTILCYMVEGKGTKTFLESRKMLLATPELAHGLLQAITDVTIKYLQSQIEAGADLVQVFDSWSGLLDRQTFNTFCLPYIEQIAMAIDGKVPVIYFPRGNWHSLADVDKLPIDCIGLDWATPPAYARSQSDKCLQGNFDPAKLLMSPDRIEADTKEMIRAFGTHNYIANLGHGISPNVPVENAKRFVDTVKNWSN